ncbi:RNA dependent RNA polymerase [Clostridium guangxiense]|uniref:RNA dependent RNA polymerase n=1 Tax=Clostridium guangxiense TaxID=1662055 RepID=UPI001E5797C5|nr:hypothetical protein [Clostridium guangxiense]MCD2347406.1 hypothetical protein [Clostridium guangxiense]
MISKRQYHIWQYKLDDIYENDGKLMVNFSEEEAINTSETLMLYILNEKIRERNYDDAIEYKADDNGNEMRVKKNFAPIITVETGRSRKKETNEKLQRLLNEGFYINTEPLGHFVFLDNVLSGSQNKECRQIFIYEDYYEKLKEYISLGKEPAKCTISKNLTRNALTTTDVYLVPTDMKKLGICIIPDCEVPVYETVNIIKPYTRTPEEEKKFEELQQWIEERDNYNKVLKEVKESINSDECKLEKVTKENRQKSTYKTVNQWKDEGRKVKVEELGTPKARIYVDKSGKYFALYIEEQTEEFAEEETTEIPITEWSTGLQLVTEENHECKEVVFDGMGIISKELGDEFKKFLEVNYPITGYQLRIPAVKGFFPVVDFHSYFKKHNIEFITDMWGQEHKVSEIDILTTESTFKAKLNVIGVKDDGSEKKEWMFKSIDEYKDLLIKYGYDVIGISNFAKPVEEEFRRATYQLWLALDVRKLDMLALGNIQGDMIHKVLSIYRKDEIEWEDIKYIETFLNLIQKENAESNLAKQCADAIHALRLNKKMVFDRKVIQTIKDVINKKIDDMCMGRFYVKGKYLYVTQDILAFLRYAGADNRELWEYSGFLGKRQFYCGGKIMGRNLLARNPIMSYSEITKADFVDYTGEDSEFIKHMDNIVQMPLGTEPDRLSGNDKDGDEVLVLSTDINFKETHIEFMQHYNFIVSKEDSDNYGKNLLEVINEKLQVHFNNRFPDKDVVTIEDFVVPSLVQVNDEDKATAPSKEWNKGSVVQFILDSEDRTGVITDINTAIENVANNEEDLLKYALPIAIMKDLQGKMIDASKSGLFDQVVIPKVIKLKYRKKPQFMYFKDGNEFNKDYSTMSALDFFSARMQKFKEYVNTVMREKTNAKIRGQHFENIYNYLMNPELDGEVVQNIIEGLDKVYSDFIKENRTLAILKSHINPYSNDDRYKREREIVDQKYKVLYEKTKKAAEAVCNCPSLLATAAVRMTYINSKYNNQNDNYSFCWIVAPEGILQNIKMHEDKEKIYVVKANKGEEDVFEWLGEYYKTKVFNGEYPLKFDEEKDMSISKDYLRKEGEELSDICDLKITIMGVEKGKAEEVSKEMLGKPYKLFVTENNWIGIDGNMSIKEKETLSSGIDLRKYIGHDIIVKEIITAKDSQTIIKVIADVKG